MQWDCAACTSANTLPGAARAAGDLSAAEEAEVSAARALLAEDALEPLLHAVDAAIDEAVASKA